MKKLIPLFALFIFTSCDPAVKYDRIIENQSSYDIWIYTDSSYMGYPPFVKDSILIKSQQVSHIVDIHKIGRVTDFEDCTVAEGALAAVIDQFDSLELDLDLSSNENWTYTVIEEGTFKSGVCECRLIITDGDIK